MLRVIRSLLLKIVDDIDAGNSNITEGEAIEIVDNLRRFTDKEKRLSKYAACEYLNVSRATFDNYVREGKLPRGKHEIGFKELSWNKKTLDEFIRRTKISLSNVKLIKPLLLVLTILTERLARLSMVKYVCLTLQW